jgi:exosome complex RNA-binding protein Rrp42 (RNase PH superfamily)
MEESRKRRQTEQQLQSDLTYLLADHMVDMGGLCVVPNQYVWKLNVDLLVLSAKQGSVIDTCSRAIRAALLHTKLPTLTPLNTKQESRGAQVDLAVDSDITKATTPKGANDCPIVITISVLKCPPKGAPVLVLDTTLEEEICASSQVRVAVKPGGHVCAVLSQGGSLALGMIPDVISTAVQASTAVLDAMAETLPDDLHIQTLLEEQFQIR